MCTFPPHYFPYPISQKQKSKVKSRTYRMPILKGGIDKGIINHLSEVQKFHKKFQQKFFTITFKGQKLSLFQHWPVYSVQDLTGECKRKWYFAPFSFALVMLWQIVPRIEFITTIVLIRFVQKVIRCLTMIDGSVFQHLAWSKVYWSSSRVHTTKKQRLLRK